MGVVAENQFNRMSIVGTRLANPEEGDRVDEKGFQNVCCIY